VPELPDVELFRRRVEHTCLDRIVGRVDLADPGSVERASMPGLRTALDGAHLRKCQRHGKYLLIDLGRAGWLVMHFGTNGSLHFIQRTQPDPPYVRLTVVFEDGNRLAYVNPRRIGRVRLAESAQSFIAQAGLGPDALDPALDEPAFRAVFTGRRQAVKAVLMDQARLAGIGNIYSDEILFHARLYPRTLAATLGPGETHRLFTAMRSVLQTAIECGAGAEDFTDRLPRGFLLPERHVGGRCPRCGAAIKADKQGGRTGYFCPICQPANAPKRAV
jgi:formamidopyrimidine-DNA glycosylase